MHTHLIGDNPCQCGLSKSRRAIEQYVIQRIVSLFRSFYINLQIFLCFLLTDIIIQTLGTKAALDADVFFHHIGCDNTSFHTLFFLHIHSLQHLLQRGFQQGFHIHRLRTLYFFHRAQCIGVRIAKCYQCLYCFLQLAVSCRLRCVCGCLVG